MKYWVARFVRPWTELKISIQYGGKEFPNVSQADADVAGSVGFMFVFDDYDKALTFVDGDAGKLVPMESKCE